MTNSISRRAIGLLAALIVLTLVAGFSTWRLAIAARRGWAGFAYVPPIGTKTSAMAGLQPGSVFMVFASGPAERAGIQRGDVIEAINGIPSRDLDKLTQISQSVRRGTVLHYRILRNGQPREIALRFDSPTAAPMFMVTFVTSTVVALTFLVIGAFVFWRRPMDSRAVVFYAMTLVAAVTFANTAMIQVESQQLRGIVSAEQSISQVWHLVILATTSLFFAPLLLHLALTFPKERPVLKRRGRKIFLWIYGYPVAFCVYGAFALGFLEAFTRRATQNFAVRASLIVLGAIALAAVVNLVISIVRRGFREGVYNAPASVITIILSLFAAMVGLSAYSVAHTKSVLPFFVAMFLLVMIGALTFATYPVATFVALFRSYRESGAEERRQVKWPLWATMVAVGGKIVLGFIGFAITLQLTFRGSGLPAMLYSFPTVASQLLFILIPVSFAFAILKYRLMNIDVIIRRTVLYSILTFVVFALYGVLVVSVGTALVKFAGMTSQTMLVASTVVIALAAVPIRNRLQQMVDRNLFRQKRDYALALRNISNATGSSGIDEFLKACAEQIQEALQNRFVVIALRRDREFVAAAKVGVPDEVIGRVRVPVDADLSSVPGALHKIGASLVVPVRSAAILAVGPKLSEEDFSHEDREFLGAAASQMAIGIENTRLRTEEEDFEQARAMQQILLPTRFPQLDGIEITGMWQPARSVGGDYFDTLALGGGKAAICIGDVAGKGMPAALLMANLQAAVKATASARVEPAIVCERVKEIVGGNLVGGKFISFFYGVIDSAARTFAYSNAGHNPPILVRRDSTVERLAKGGPAMCRLFKDVPQEQDVTAFGSGDRIVLFTDGASEARRGEEEFGDDRLIELILKHPHLGARALQDRIAEELRDFTGGDFSDDVTLVVIAAR